MTHEVSRELLSRLSIVSFLLTFASAWLLSATEVPILWPTVGLLIAWLSAYRHQNVLQAMVCCWIGATFALLTSGWTASDAVAMSGLSTLEAAFATELIKRIERELSRRTGTT